MFAPSLANELGLPIDISMLPAKEKEYWQSLHSAAEAQLLKRYPILEDPPNNIHVSKHTQTQFLLFRSILPPKLAAQGDNSLVVLGNWANGRIQVTAEIASLWVVAYLENLMPPSMQAKLSSEDETNRDIALVEIFRRKRYLDSYTFRISVFETPEFDDALIRDLELRSDRKKMRIPGGWRDIFGLKPWFREWFTGYFAVDYAGLVEEFLEDVEKR